MNSFEYFVVEAYTDGACSGKTLEGGAAAVVLFNGKEYIATEREFKSTNQRMEILAVIKAFEIVENLGVAANNGKIVIYSDSAYVINCFNQMWYLNWFKNGWVNTHKKPIINKDLWERLFSYYFKYDKGCQVIFEKVKGHSGVQYNEKADKLAVAAARGELQ